MARERMVTRTIQANFTQFIIIDTNTLEVTKMEDVFYGPADGVEDQIREYWCKEADKIVKCEILRTEEHLLGMSEVRFARLAERLPDRAVN